MQSSNIWSFLISLAYIVPFVFVYLAGIVLSIVFRRRIGKASIFTVIACLLFLLTSLINILHYVWLYFLYLPSSHDYQLLSTVTTIEGAAKTLLEIVAFVFLFLAIFGKRSEAMMSNPPGINEYNFNRNQ